MLRLPILAACLALAAAGAEPARPQDSFALPEAPALGDYLTYAALHSPGLEAAYQRWQAARERVPQAEALPDPRLSYRYYIEEVETRVGPQQQAVGLSQSFPWFGKLRLRGEVASEEAEAARQRFEAARLKLAHEVTAAYADYHYLGRALGVVERTRELMRQLEQVARTRYRSAAVSHAEVIRAQVELGKLEDRLRELEALRPAAVARLNAAIGRPAGEPLPWPEGVPQAAPAADEAQLLSLLREANPELAAMAHLIAREERAVKLAGRDFYPDFTFGLDYIDTGPARMGSPSDSGKDPVIAMVSINLPIWRGKYRAAEREARARRRAAALALQDRQNALGAAARMALFEYRDAERKIDLYRDTLVPKARQSLRATETAFRGGAASFFDLVDAERALLEFELAYERALADRVRRLAELEMLVGRSLAAQEETGE